MTKKTERRLMQVAAWQELQGASDDVALAHQRRVRKWCRNTPECFALGALGRDFSYFGTPTTHRHIRPR